METWQIEAMAIGLGLGLLLRIAINTSRSKGIQTQSSQAVAGVNRFCTACGTAIEAEWRNCAQCGAAIGNVQQTTEVQTEEICEAISKDVISGPMKALWTLFLVQVCLVTLGVGIGGVFNSGVPGDEIGSNRLGESVALCVVSLIWANVLSALGRGRIGAYGWAQGLAMLWTVPPLLLAIVAIASATVIQPNLVRAIIVLAAIILSIWQYSVLIGRDFAAYFGAKCPKCGSSTVLSSPELNAYKCGKCNHRWLRETDASAPVRTNDQGELHVDRTATTEVDEGLRR